MSTPTLPPTTMDGALTGLPTRIQYGAGCADDAGAVLRVLPAESRQAV